MRKIFNLLVLAALLFGLARVPTSGSAARLPAAVNGLSGLRLPPGGTVQGLVKPAQSGLIIQAVGSAGRVAASTLTDQRGAYALEGLAPGKYRLEVLTSLNAPLPLKSNRVIQVQNVDAFVQARSLELAMEENAELGQHMAAPATATIQGTVTGVGHGALQYSYVYAYEVGNEYPSYYAYTDAGGQYILNVAAGSYKLKFDRNGEFAPEWYNNQPDIGSAAVLTVADGASLTGIDAELAVGGTISGNVTDGSLNPLSDVYVTAIEADGNSISYAYTLGDGTYQLEGLPSGNFRVQFDPRYSSTPDYIPEFYNNKPDLNSADPVAVTLGGNTPNINAALSLGGAITGIVTALDSGTPLASTVYIYNSNTVGLYDYINNAYANIDGEYELHGLAAGVYYLRAVPPSDSPYLSEFYENQSGLAHADPVTVVTGATTPINFALERGATITGQVTGPVAANLAAPNATAPIEGVRVRLYDAEYTSIKTTITNAQGYYTITALTTGSYYLGFSGDEQHNYITEYYDGKATLAEADPIQITAPQIAQADAELAEGGVFSGRVTAADSGDPLENVSVSVYGLDECNNISYIKSTSTLPSGYYTVTGLTAGTYYANFNTFSSSGLTKLYLGHPYLANSRQNAWPTGGGGDTPGSLGDPIQVTPGAPLSNIHAVLQRGGQISGSVIAADNSLPLENVDITIHTVSDGYNYLGHLLTDASGNYTTPSLAAGSYTLYFSTYYDDGAAAAYIPEYYNNQWQLNQAITIPVTLGTLTPGIDVSLERGAQVGGKLIATDTSAPLEGVEINLSPMFSDGTFRYTYTDQNGDFVTPGVRPGPYTLNFYTGNWDVYARDYIDESYNNQALGSGEVFTLTTPTLHGGFNASLELGGRISGVVTAESNGAPLPNAYAYAYNANGWMISYDSTDANGNYTIYGLPAGPTKVEFYGPHVTELCRTVVYADEYYNNKPDFTTADPITVTPPGTTTDINASLAIEQIVGLIKLFLPFAFR